MFRKHALTLTAAAAFILAVAAACGGGDSQPTPSPEPASPTPTQTPSPTLPPIPLPGTEFRLVYREHGENEDVIWRTSPTDLTQREQLGVLGHAANCPSTASISPDGRFLFYIVQPAGTECQRDLSRAEAYVYDIPWNETTKVAEGVDIRFKPLWTADSRLVYYRRYAGFEILSSNVSVLYYAVNRKHLPWEPSPTAVPTPSPSPTPDPNVTPTPTPTPDPNATPIPTIDPRATPTPTPEPGTTIIRESFARANGFIPLGIGPDGRSLLFIQLPGGTGGPTLLGQYTPGTFDAITEEAAKAAATAAALGTQTPDPAAPPTPSPTPNARLVATLTDETPISFSLSSDGTKVAFTTQAIADGEFVERAYWVDVPTRTITPMPLDGLDPIQGFEIVWHPDNARVAIGMMPFGVDPGSVALVPYGGGAPNLLVGGGAGYDEPVMWSPDGAYLAVRHIEVDGNGTVIFQRMDLVAPIGQRATFSESGEVEVVGWSPPNAPVPTPAPPPEG